MFIVFHFNYILASGDSKSRESAFDLHEKLIPYPEIFSYHKRPDSLNKNGSHSTTSLSKRYDLIY